MHGAHHEPIDPYADSARGSGMNLNWLLVSHEAEKAGTVPRRIDWR